MNAFMRNFQSYPPVSPIPPLIDQDTFYGIYNRKGISKGCIYYWLVTTNTYVIAQLNYTAYRIFFQASYREQLTVTFQTS